MLIPDKKYFSIGDVAKITGVKSYVLRYWESEFKLLRPARRESGHRKYIAKDIENISKIKDLLYNKKYTISGAKRFLLAESRKKGEQMDLDLDGDSALHNSLKELKKEIKDILKILK